MVTNYPQELVTQPTAANATTYAPTYALTRLWKRIQFLLCSMHGHDTLLHFDNNRMFLRCASCGHETPGWELDQRRPRLRFRGDPKRQYLARPTPFDSDERRIA